MKPTDLCQNHISRFSALTSMNGYGMNDYPFPKMLNLLTAKTANTPWHLLIILAALLVAAACTQTPPTPTPNIEATVHAGIVGNTIRFEDFTIWSAD